MNLFDSHCHIEDERFDADRAQVLERMREQNVTRAICAGSDLDSSARIVKLVTEHPNLYGAVGVHPQEAESFDEHTLGRLTEWLKLDRMVGVGEIGLDYYYENAPRETQKRVLEAQLLLAHALDVPAMFHIRDAHGDTLDLLRAHKNELPSGVMHCFSGSTETARAYLDLGFDLSFAGPVTFKNARKLAEAAAYCPLEHLLIETDSPYLAPTPVRGTRNEPANVRFVAQRVAELKGIPVGKLVAHATANTMRLYRIADSSADNA